LEIQWYPGHMAKAKRQIKEVLKVIDAVLELVDARAPESSHIPDIKEIVEEKPIIRVLNKEDLAEKNVTENWIKYFKNQGITSFSVDSIHKDGIKSIIDYLRKIKKQKNSVVRCIVMGVPNVGKSSFINQMAGRKGAKTGDIPGITKGKMWLKVNEDLELLDTPGILWPKFDEKEVGIKLAILGCIKEEIYDAEKIALILIDFLIFKAKEELMKRFKLDTLGTPEEILEKIGEKRGCLLPGGKIDALKAAKIVLKEYREGRIGRISLEEPENKGFWEKFKNNIEAEEEGYLYEGYQG